MLPVQNMSLSSFFIVKITCSRYPLLPYMRNGVAFVFSYVFLKSLWDLFCLVMFVLFWREISYEPGFPRPKSGVENSHSERVQVEKRAGNRSTKNCGGTFTYIFDIDKYRLCLSNNILQNYRAISHADRIDFIGILSNKNIWVVSDRE